VWVLLVFAIGYDLLSVKVGAGYLDDTEEIIAGLLASFMELIQIGKEDHILESIDRLLDWVPEFQFLDWDQVHSG
jgi:hypothetical protein